MRELVILVVLTWTCAAFAGEWYGADPESRTVENELIRVRYGPDKKPEGNILTGITEFTFKPRDVNYADAMDAYGYGYAKYHSGGPDAYEVTHEGADYVEITLRMTNGVDVVKKDRLYRGLPILEIEYERLGIVWWEDFYKIPGDDLVYSVHGIPNEIDETEHAALRKAAEAAAGHNHGDAFLAAAGKTVEECTYNGHFIFGVYSRKSGRGLGFVMPAAVGLHDGWKLWSMHNYESFPFYGAEKKLPLKRWIFVIEGGREGLFATGKRIAEAAAEGKGLSAAFAAAADEKK